MILAATVAATLAWTPLPAAALPRGEVAAARVGGFIYVAGGFNSGGRTSAAVELFDPRTRRWTGLPNMRTPRHGLGGAALGNRVFALKGGGVPGLSASPTIEFLDVPAR